MKRHLLIAGTGRAGTSVLVKFLNELGIETHLSVHQDGSGWDDTANAGLEDKLLRSGAAPYVVKSPWLFQSIDEVLASKDIAIDGVIIPVRDLAEAASSRAILELQNIHKAQEWFTEEAAPWKAWGSTPGGLLYSLDPVDQARLLAVGFHHLIERLTTAGVPIYLLAFPRFTSDPEYTYRVLKGCLPDVSMQNAIAAHNKVMDTTKVRVTGELRGEHTLLSSPENLPSLEAADNVALRRELTASRKALAEALAKAGALSKEVESLEARLADAEVKRDEYRTRLETVLPELERLRSQCAALMKSTSWRLTEPLRRITRILTR